MLNGTHPIAPILLLGLVAYALYRQSITSPVASTERFRLPAIYLIIGLVLSGPDWPTTSSAWALFAAGLALSVVVGAARGLATRIWFSAPRDEVLRRGTALSIALYVALIVAKIALALLAARFGAPLGSGVGQVLVVVAISLFVQAQIVFMRATSLRRAASATAVR